MVYQALPETTAAVTVDGAVYRRRAGGPLVALVERAGAGRMEVVWVE